MNPNILLYISRKLAGQAKHGKFLNFVRIIAIGGVMLGTLALIISMSVLSGFETSLKEQAIRFTSHIRVDTYKQKTIPNYDFTVNKIKRKFPIVESAVPFVEREALISSKMSIDGIIIKSINRDFDITNISSKITKGKLPTENSKEILIGERLADKLSVNLSDSIIIYFMKPGAEISKITFPEVLKFKIAGLYKSGMAQYDNSMVFADFNYMQSMLNFTARQSVGIDIMLSDISSLSAVSLAMEEYLNYPYMCSNVLELHSSIFAWIELQKEPIPLVLALIGIVAVMNIITILLISIVEKTHTIGILRALGMPSSSILGIFIFQGTIIGSIGTILGAGLAYLFSILQQTYQIIKLDGNIYFLDAVPINIDINNYILVVTISLSLSFLVTLIPSLIALKVKPIKAINFR